MKVPGKGYDKMSIILDHVNYVYGEDTPLAVHALNDICLKIPDGQFIGIIGHTGSGKSTLMQHLNGLIRATDGHIYFNGEDIYDKDYDMKKLRSKVGLVFQYPEHQLFEIDVFSDVCFGPKNLGLDKKEVELRAYDALKKVGLPDELFYQSPFELSGGQKRVRDLRHIHGNADALQRFGDIVKDFFHIRFLNDIHAAALYKGEFRVAEQPAAAEQFVCDAHTVSRHCGDHTQFRRKDGQDAVGFLIGCLPQDQSHRDKGFHPLHLPWVVFPKASAACNPDNEEYFRYRQKPASCPVCPCTAPLPCIFSSSVRSFGPVHTRKKCPAAKALSGCRCSA